MKSRQKYIKNYIGLSLIVTILVAGCYSIDKPVYQKHSLSKKAMVVSANIHASEAGLEIMHQGGNAVDAAIAVHFALAVAYPRAGNLGGGGFALVRDSHNLVKSLDFREVAPGMAHKDMFLDDDGNYITDSSLKGILAAGVPGSVAGMWKMYQELDPNLSWAELLEPAIKLAREGFPISEQEAAKLNEHQEGFMQFNMVGCPFVKAKPWKAGDLLVQLELAETLEKIAEGGADVFYKGALATRMAEAISAKGGIITEKDLNAYRAIWRKPIHSTYKQYEFFSMGLPSSGGITILQILKMIENFSLDISNPHSAYNIHLITEASRAAFEDRASFLGDPDFTQIPVDKLLSGDRLSKKMDSYDPVKAGTSKPVNEGIKMESYETTHFTITDNEGRCIAITTTLNSNYGSLVWLPGLGFFLNNEMNDFSVKPGQMDQFGLLSSEANAIQPGKRMLSCMSPTIITKNKQLILALGTPGGSTIISSVVQVLLNVIEFDLELTKAVNLPRYHHQWIPDELLLEGNLNETPEAATLSAKGHKIRAVKTIGAVNAIRRFDNGMFEAVGDIRDESHALGL